MINESSNNILTIIFKNNTSSSFAFPSAKTKDEAFENALLFEQINRDDVAEYHFSVNSEKNLESFNYFNAEKKELDEKKQAVDFKCDEVRKKRDHLFARLDLEFMKSLEDDCSECKDHIVLVKNYLRDLPSLMKEEFKSYDTHQEVIFFNPFNNIFNVYLLNEGSGYTNPPTITIDPPDEGKKGFQLEAVPLVKDGKLFDVKVTKIGSGYSGFPKILISPPNEPDGEQAYAVALLPENDIYNME